MSTKSSSVWSKSSISSRRSQRSGKSLVEKMQDLGFNFFNKKISTLVHLQYIDIKLENNHVSDYSVMTPKLNLEQIIYFQPELSSCEADLGKRFYEFRDFGTTSKEAKKIKKISDIEVKSYKPTKKMIFRKKKRQSSIISRIEGILNKNKIPLPSICPSEESIVLEHISEPEKNIHDLPENVLQKIFMHFTQQERNLILSRVCKWVAQSKFEITNYQRVFDQLYHYRSWYYVLKDPVFWPQLIFCGDKIPKSCIIQLIRRYPSVKKLHLTSVLDVIDILQELCRCNNNITDLAVKHCNVGHQDFARMIIHVISCCTNLEILNIKGMQFQSDRFFLEIGRLKNLRSINLTGNKLMKTQNLITLSVNCRNLRELRILDISLDNRQGSSLRDEDLIFMVFYLQPSLQVLKIDMQQLKNISYQAILKCTKLTCLTMKNCLHLNSLTFRQFPVLKNLKKLKFTRAINLRPEDFQFVFGSESLSTVENLDINGCWTLGEIGLRAITHGLQSLKSLSLKNCKLKKGNYLKHLSRCPELTHLNIAHTELEVNHLLQLQKYVQGLRSLVIDISMSKEFVIRTLKKHFPSIKIILSSSEFQKLETPLDDYKILE